MSIFRSAFERIFGLRVWVLVASVLVVGGVTSVVAQTNTGGADSAVVSTLAGTGVEGFVDGPGASAQFFNPGGVAVDGSGNVYIADYFNERIRKVDPLGVVSTLAGTGMRGFADGPGLTAQFNNPSGVAVDGSGNVYVGDLGNNRIRKIDSFGVVSTLAGTGFFGFVDGPGLTAQFRFPEGVAVDGSGNVYVADSYNSRIRKIDSLGVVSTLAGTGVQGFVDGPGLTAQFRFTSGVAVDGLGNVYVADYENSRIRKINSLGVVSTLSGTGVQGFVDGPAATAQFNNPTGVAVDASGNVYVADQTNSRIRKIDSLGVVSTLAGTGVQGFVDGPGLTAQFRFPGSLAVDGLGNLYVADILNQRIRKIDTVNSQSTTTTAQPTTTTSQPSTTTILPFITSTASIVRGANNAAGASVYAVTLRMTGATSGAGYEIVVSSGHVPEPLPPDPTTHRYGKTAVNGEVVLEYSLVAPRGVFRADLYPAGSPSPIASVEVK